MDCRSGSSKTARDLYKQGHGGSHSPIPTFVEPLDNILGGGIRPGIVTELVGDSGIGKTTMCIQLCLNVQIPQVLQGLAAEAIFIDTENSLVASRMEQMAHEFVKHCNMVTPKNVRGKQKLSDRYVLSRIRILKPKDMAQFKKIIVSLTDYISKNRKIRLIVIDSIAFPFYTEGEDFQSRVQPLYSIGQVLHYIAGHFGVAIVLTNNLTTRFDPSGTNFFVPHLGDNWYHIPNQRISLYWGVRGFPRKRIAEIVKSSCVEPAKTYFRVTPAGIRE